MSNCIECQDNTVPETNYNYIPAPCLGCEDVLESSCITYDGTGLSCIGVTKGDTITAAINGLMTFSNGLLGKITSTSLAIVKTGTCSSNLAINIVPSTDEGNVFLLGEDGKAYVPTPGSLSQTFQQSLITGSTLNRDNTIDAATHALTISNVTNLELDITSSFVVASSGNQLINLGTDGNIVFNSVLEDTVNNIFTISSSGELTLNGDDNEENGTNFTTIFNINPNGELFLYNNTSGTQSQTFHVGVDGTAILSGGIASNTTAALPHSSSILDLKSITKGALLPRMTTSQKNAIDSPAEGLTVYDITIHALCFYNGTSWKTVTSS